MSPHGVSGKRARKGIETRAAARNPLLGVFHESGGLRRAHPPYVLAKVEATVTAQGEDTATYDQAAGIFEKMSLSPDYPEFLTLPLYDARLYFGLFSG